jgi:cytidyltransferase-like protein
MNTENKIIAVSGGFDPVHIGHVRMFEEAKKLGTHLVVIINSDEWLKRKKGFAFMPEKERAELIKKFAAVDDTHVHYSDDIHVSDALRDYTMEIDGERHPIHIFANGGDRKNEADIPEAQVCKEKDIEMIFNVGAGGKVQSSSWLTDAVKGGKLPYEETRPWGGFTVFERTDSRWIKTLVFTPGNRFSLQTHRYRSEMWICVEGELQAQRGKLENGEPVITETVTLTVGDTFFIPVGDVHRLGSNTGGTVVEVAFGDAIEEDITRYQDDYNRA